MKKIYYLFLAALMALAGCSESYDDSEIFDKYKNLQQEVDNLKSQVDETKKLLNALANNLSILSVKETADGYTITFSDNSIITVKHGKDGADGKDGEDGKDGKDGIDGEDGTDGKDGKNGDSFIQSIVVGEDAVTFTLADGQVIVIPIGDKVAKNNQIFYTTTDGKKFFPSSLDPGFFGAILVSNTYENGQGVLTFDDTVTKIGGEAFYDCDSLTSIIIPNSVTSIKYGAFRDCSSLTSITIPDGVTEIGYGAFTNCSGLTEFKGKYASADGRCIIVNGELVYFAPFGITEYTIPNGVTSIGGEAFLGCSGLTSITIPNSVTSIGYNAFWYCSGLTSITIPNSVTEIGYSAFYNCSGLTSITIPNSVTEIGNRAFYNCSGLTSITIPNSVTEIEQSTFSFCLSLESINIPDNVTSIGGEAFLGCSGLTSITIPDGVTEIGYGAFMDCSSLLEVYCKPTTPPAVVTNLFTNTPPSLQIYVPTASVDAYKAAANWSDYADKIVGYDF